MPQVKTLYPYKGNGLDVKKDEVMFLLDKTNQDWWNVRYLHFVISNDGYSFPSSKGWTVVTTGLCQPIMLRKWTIR